MGQSSRFQQERRQATADASTVENAVMGQSSRWFRRTCAVIALKSHFRNKQGALASELAATLQDSTDLNSSVTRFLNGDVTVSRHFEVMPIIFARRVVGDAYPAHFLLWLDRAYEAYDRRQGAAALGKSDNVSVRRILEEAKMYFGKPDRELADRFPRHEGARKLMCVMATAVERRTLGVGLERVRESIDDAIEAAREFSTLKRGARMLSDSDEFHLALAIHLADWLLSELPDGETIRKQTLETMRDLGALRAYEWLANQTGDWQHQYNVAEIYGELSAPASGRTCQTIPPRAAINCLARAIELNPRLADFEAKTKSDGVAEPLSKAPALRHILPVIRNEKGAWLEDHVAAYRLHADLYRENVTKGVKAMVNHMSLLKRGAAMIAGVMLALAASPLVLDCVAAAKPIFPGV